jgi:hypothetical protein
MPGSKEGPPKQASDVSEKPTGAIFNFTLKMEAASYPKKYLSVKTRYRAFQTYAVVKQGIICVDTESKVLQ